MGTGSVRRPPPGDPDDPAPDQEGTSGAFQDTRTAKCFRMLRVLAEAGPLEKRRREGAPCLDRTALARASALTLRSTDAILSFLRHLEFEIGLDEKYGYHLVRGPVPTFLPHLAAEDNLRHLERLLHYLESHPESTLETPSWIALLREILARSRSQKEKVAGHAYQEAMVDDAGRLYRVDEPEILYLSVHRPAPDAITRSRIDQLVRAIQSRTRVRMKYVDRKGRCEWIQVDPHFVFFREGTYYLAGVQVEGGSGPLARPRFKPFTITRERCLSLDLLHGRTFQVRPENTPEKRLSATGIRGSRHAALEAEIDIFGQHTYNVCEMQHGESSGCEWICRDPGAQHLRIRAVFGSEYDLVRFILSFGQYAEVRKPERIRKMVQENIRGMQARYGPMEGKERSDGP